MKTYYETENAIRTAHRSDGRTVKAWLKRPDFPRFVKGKGWPAADVDAAVLRIREAQAGTARGANADLKREKLQKEIERLVEDVRLRKCEADREAGLLISREDALRDARELVTMFTDVFAQWIGAVKVVTGNAALVVEAERLRDKALALMREKLEAA